MKVPESIWFVSQSRNWELPFSFLLGNFFETGIWYCAVVKIHYMAMDEQWAILKCQAYVGCQKVSGYWQFKIHITLQLLKTRCACPPPVQAHPQSLPILWKLPDIILFFDCEKALFCDKSWVLVLPHSLPTWPGWIPSPRRNFFIYKVAEKYLHLALLWEWNTLTCICEISWTEYSLTYW